MEPKNHRRDSGRAGIALSLFAVGAVLALPSVALAQPATLLFSGTTRDDALRVIDPTTGTLSCPRRIISSGNVVYGGQGYAVQPSTGTLYAILSLNGNNSRYLVTLNPATGVATTIGSLGDRFASIAFDGNDGGFYGITGNGATTPHLLYAINPATAAQTQVCGLGGSFGEALAFHSATGQLYHASGDGAPGQFLETVDANTCAVTNIPLSGDPYREFHGIVEYTPTNFVFTDFNSQFGTLTTDGGVSIVSTDGLFEGMRGLAFRPVFLPTDDVDLSVDSSITPDPVQSGSNYTQTLTVTNLGTDAGSTNVGLSLLYTSSDVFVSATPSQGNCVNSTASPVRVFCDFGAIGATGDATVDVVFTAATGSSGSSSRFWAYASECDSDAANNVGTDFVQILGDADLAITKSGVRKNTKTGRLYTYTFEVTNNGPAQAFNTVLTDTLPSGTTFSSASGANCSPSGSTVTCNLGTLNNGDVVSFSMVVEISAPARTTVTNTATVDSDSNDPTSGNNTSSVSTKIVGKR